MTHITTRKRSCPCPFHRPTATPTESVSKWQDLLPPRSKRPRERRGAQDHPQSLMSEGQWQIGGISGTQTRPWFQCLSFVSSPLLPISSALFMIRKEAAIACPLWKSGLVAEHHGAYRRGHPSLGRTQNLVS